MKSNNNTSIIAVIQFILDAFDPNEGVNQLHNAVLQHLTRIFEDTSEHVVLLDISYAIRYEPMSDLRQ